MTGEISLYGVLMPPTLLSAAAAAIIVAVLRRLLTPVGAYGWVWHPALFDTALFVVLLGGIDRLVSG
jgi:hypothetical protein